MASGPAGVSVVREKQALAAATAAVGKIGFLSLKNLSFHNGYSLGERVYDIQVAPAQRRVPHAPPRHMCLLEGMTAEDREEEYDGSYANSFLSAGDYATYFSTRLQARLPEERKKHRTAAHYRAEAEAKAEAAAAPAGPAGAVLGDVPFPPSMEVVLDPALGLGSAIIFPAEDRLLHHCSWILSMPHTSEISGALPEGRRCRDIALHITNFNVHHRGCPMLLQAWALDKLSLILPVPARLIPTYGPPHFQSRSRGHFDFGNNPTIRWTYPWWRIRLATTGSMNLNYVLYASVDRSMAYFPDRISRQYGMIQRIPRIHYFESGLMTPSFLIHMADRWRNRNTRYLGQGVMQDTRVRQLVLHPMMILGSAQVGV
ncbi:hypothetical protein JCGZ_11152 [Jatropha curcas]|uniref:Aminotransferase-like plant mobile domain-containing protein n=1 Tax=Jatropha curcas TaxID=180498 RepID=A0A067KT90_JATCU|nr:hypothetical protein JCGZ_11152 [Jatropha curcas]